MVKHTQANCRQFADELFECVWSFCEVGTWRINFVLLRKIFVTLFFYLLHVFLSRCSGVWIAILLIVNFLLRKIFLAKLNEAILPVEIAAFRFPQKIFLKGKLTFRILSLIFFRRITFPDLNDNIWQHKDIRFLAIA